MIGVLLAMAAVVTSIVDAAACTVQITGLRKEFKRSINVFIGEVVSVEGLRKERLPADLAADWDMLDRVTFRIKRAWKGQKTGTVSVFSNVVCTCPNRVLRFEKGRELVVFADDDAFADACSTRIYDIEDSRLAELGKPDMKRLDNFWFRTWATLYPF